MLAASLMLALLSYADDTDVAHRVQIHLSASAQPWMTRNLRKLREIVPKEGAVMVFEVELNERGGFTRVVPSLGSGDPEVDRLGRELFGVLPRLEDPPEDLAGSSHNLRCVVVLQLGARAASVAAACLPDEEAPQVARRDDMPLDAATEHLFDGWSAEADGNGARARAAFRKAVEAAPEWELASVAFGLNLARSGRIDEARPLLERATRARTTPEILRYLGATEEPTRSSTRSSPTASVETGEADVTSCQREESEIFLHIRARFPLLIECIDAERERNPEGTMPPAIPVSFVITPPGAIEHITVEHRFFEPGGTVSTCFQKALAGNFEERGGSNCPVLFDVAVKTIAYTPEN